jgi:cholesterol oxidase
MAELKQPVRLEVREWLKGYVGLAARDYDAGFIAGIHSAGGFTHDMWIKIDDIDRFASDPAHAARLDGQISCQALGGTFTVTNGLFQMFVDSQDPSLKFMKYRMPYRDRQGRLRTVVGHKTVHDDHALDLLPDTTTLYLKIIEGQATSDDPPEVGVAQGVIHMQFADLLRTLTTFRSPGADLAEGARARAVFAKFFFGKVWEIYGPKS